MVSETEYLADSLFDYPLSEDGGWQYATLDQNNIFGEFKPRDASRDTATPMAFLVGDEENCLLGRDVVHPGYRLRPCLEWKPKVGGTFLLEAEISPIISTCAGSIFVSVYVDDVRMVSGTINYPQCMTIALPVEVRDQGFIRIVFACLGTIDQNFCLYFARVSALSERASPAVIENQPDCVKVDMDRSWVTLYRALKESLPGPVPGDDLVDLARKLYEPSAVSAQLLMKSGQRVWKKHFGHLELNFRKPGFFAAKRSSS